MSGRSRRCERCSRGSTARTLAVFLFVVAFAVAVTFAAVPGARVAVVRLASQVSSMVFPKSAASCSAFLAAFDGGALKLLWTTAQVGFSPLPL